MNKELNSRKNKPVGLQFVDDAGWDFMPRRLTKVGAFASLSTPWHGASAGPTLRLQSVVGPPLVGVPFEVKRLSPWHTRVRGGCDVTTGVRLSGFTIIELMAASAILIIVVTLSLFSFMYALKENSSAMVQNELDMDVQHSMEELKKDLRLSALNKMFFHPLGSGSFSAVSFPLAYDSDGNGAVELGTNGKVVWDETVIFHVWKTTPNQLRRTRFRPRNNALTDAQMQEQLNYVATNGCATNKTGGGTWGFSNATTDVVFENLFDWSVVPQSGVYDGYDTVTNRDEGVNLGSCLLSNGMHTFTFTVIGSNSASKGYNIGLDTLTVSPDGMEREAELQIPSGTANPTNMLMANIGSWSHNRQLYFAAVSPGAAFTLTMTNDCWEETSFRGAGQVFEDTALIWDVNTLDYLVSLDGNTGAQDQEGWYAKKQTGTPYAPGDFAGAFDTNSTLEGCAVRVLLRGQEMELGNCIPYDSMRADFLTFSGLGPLKITGAYLSKCASQSSMTPDAAGAPIVNLGTCQIPSNSYWEVQQMPPSFTAGIQRTNSYLVTYLIADEAGMGYARYWDELNDAGGRGCWILPHASSAEAQSANWSGNTNVYFTNRLYALGMMREYFPSNGTFTSAVCDTKDPAVGNCTVSWTISTNWPCGVLSGTFSMKVRAGNSNNCVDAPAWSNVAALASSGASVNLGNNRYVQFQARMSPCSSGTHAIRLNHFNMSWAGETKYVDIGGTFTKGPNNGIWEIKVDGARLVRGMSVNLEIYQDVYTKKGPRRITSALTSEVTPRNTGK